MYKRQLLGLPFGMTTLVIAHTAFSIPYVFMLVKARLVGMDQSLLEAAQDLGAAPARVFFDITLPLVAPAIASGMLLALSLIHIYFAGRCPKACDQCKESKPPLQEITPGHFVACHLVQPQK